MKMIVSRDSLAEALAPIVRITPSKTVMPILTHVLLQTSESGELAITATNLDVAMTRRIHADVHEGGACTVPASTLAEYIGTLPSGGQVTMDLDEKSHRLALTCNRSFARMATLDANDFPPMNGGDAAPLMLVPASVLRTIIGDVEYAAATDNSRPVLAGVALIGRGDTCDFAAADGFRMAVRTIATPDGVPSDLSTIIIPAHALRHVAQVLPKTEETVTITAAPNVMTFEVGQTTVTTRLVDGQFPDYTRIIPQETPVRVVANRLDLVQAVKAARVFGRQGTELMRLNVDTETAHLTISASGSEVGDGSSTVDLADVLGDPMDVGYNGRYLLDALEHLRSDQVELCCSGPTSPGMLRPVGDEHDRVLSVIMPMVVAQ